MNGLQERGNSHLQELELTRVQVPLEDTLSGDDTASSTENMGRTERMPSRHQVVRRYVVQRANDRGDEELEWNGECDANYGHL